MICERCQIDLIVFKGEEICPKCGITFTRVLGRNPLVDQLFPKKCEKCGKTSDDEFLTHIGDNSFRCSEHIWVDGDRDERPESYPDLYDWVSYGVLTAETLEDEEDVI